ncbi:MAG: ribonuclease R [Clostridia bacterium]|nr:ribonuclease R [Clostridia bacterium]
MKQKIKDLILNLIYSDTYIPLLPRDMYYEIANQGISEEEFWRALYEMEDSYEIALTKKGKLIRPDDAGIFTGVYSASPRGDFGFVVTSKCDFFIPPKFTKNALNGDTVAIKKIEMSSKFYGKGNEAEIIAITKRSLDTFIGTFNIVVRNGNRSIAKVTPDNDKIKLDITVHAKHFNGAADGDKVLCKITSFPVSELANAKCQVLEVLGKADTKEANYKAVLLENGIITDFSDDVLAEADIVASEPLSIKGRCDLRNEIIFTIDGADAKDLDDAISVKKTDDGFILGVHIADVSHYVREGSKIDNEAINRGTSVYFTDKVVPMLPKALSNGICSLNGGVDRYALSCIITLDKSGNIIYTELKNSIINSKARGVYSELNDIIENGESSEFYGKYAHIMDNFSEMLELYEVLKAKSIRKGAMELESDEAKIILDETGHPVEIIKRERGITERLIEQFMLCANESVATYLYNASIPCVYRVHDEPDTDKISAFASFARNLGVDVSSLNPKNKITSMQLSKVLESAENTGHFSIVSSVLLRSLMKAKYSSVPKAHFGLATDLYCHFTSPIRRYPDLTVHRIIKALLDGKIDEKTIEKYDNFATLSATLSTENEIKAVSAERDIDDLYKCVYMADRIGEEYDAIICSVTGFGFFARCENLCEGLVPIEALGNGFMFDKENLILQKGKTTFRLGQRVRIRVENSDIALRRVTFALIAYEEIDAPKIDISKSKAVNLPKAKKSSIKKHSHPKKSDRNGKRTLTKSLRKKRHRK